MRAGGIVIVLMLILHHPLTIFLAQAVALSLSGVLAPGPMTAATLALGTRRRHAGAWIALGHGVVEFPLMGLIMAGAGLWMQTRSFQISVGLAGGIALVALAGMMLASLRRPTAPTSFSQTQGPVWTGIVLTGGNPYFLLWWATVGLALTSQALELGMLAFGLFALIHWLCDVLWLEILSIASYQGAKLLGPRTQVVIQAICAVAMIGFGGWFVWEALRLVGG